MSKVVFESDIAYQSVLRSAFVGNAKEYGSIYNRKTGTSKNDVVMGVVGTFVYPEQDKSYLFSEGENHNQLTLTDDVEIAGMREFIKGTGIKEIIPSEA